MLTPITCHTSSRWKVSTSSHPAAFVLFLKNISLRNFAHRMKKWASVLKKEVKKRKVCWMCKKNHILILNFVSSGVCAELPPGAFRDGGGFHSWGWSQRVFLPQSPDLTCRCVILQCLRWQRSLTIYGEIGCVFSPQLVNNSGIFLFPACRIEPWTESLICNWHSMCLSSWLCDLCISVCDTVVVVFFSQGVINLESLGKRGYRVPPSGTIQVVRNLSFKIIIII